MSSASTESGNVRYWKIAPGEGAWNWDACREGSFIAMGWEDLGDLSGLTREEFESRRDKLVAEREDWKRAGVDQAWQFANIREGDLVVVNHGFSEVLGIGRVTGPYYFVDGERHGHRLPLEWEDLTRRSVDQRGWRRTLVQLDREQFEAIRTAPPVSAAAADTGQRPRSGRQEIAESEGPYATGYFTQKTFELLEGLHQNPTKDYYMDRRDAFQTHLIEPFKQLFRDVADSLPAPILEVMETERRLFSRIPKNDYGQGGAWDFYWGAFYPKGGKRIEDAQLSLWIDHKWLEIGFYIGEYGTEERRRFAEKCREHNRALKEMLQGVLSGDEIVFAPHKGVTVEPDGTLHGKLELPWQEWLDNPQQADFDVSVILVRDDVLAFSKDELKHRVAQTFEDLFPLVLLATEDDPMSAIAKYQDWLGAETEAGLPSIDLKHALQRELALRGLQYSDWQVATFYTALQTKGFVILSGISGTGKTKLAQAFAEMLPQPSRPEVEARDDVISITVQPYMRKYNRLIIPKHFTKLYEPPARGESKKVQLSFDGRTQRCSLTYHDYTNTNYIALYFKGEATPWFSENFDVGDTVVLEPESDEDGRLVGFKIGKPSDAGFRQEMSGPAPSNSLFVPVRTDWRDSKSLLGYYNPLTGTYEWTDFLRFLLRAVRSYREGDGLAWFVILDEMNLARVEYYFADLLSVLESGRDGDGWTREPLRIHYPSDAEGDLPPSQIKLPPNIYVVGTVNVDETTHAFSPKVLDRAFTLELTEADFNGYPPDPSDLPGGQIDTAERRAVLSNFGRHGQFIRIDKPAIASYVEENGEVREHLQGLNGQLRPYQLHFGYRVFDEIVSFLISARKNQLYRDMDDAFDAAVLMKVLPKFHGSRGKLEEPLKRVLAWCLLPNAPDYETVDEALKGQEDTGAVIRALEGQTYRFARTAAKARRMLWELYTSGFASFS